MHRREYKYYVKNELLDKLRRDILPFVVYDPHLLDAPKKEYTVRSIYLDSPGLMTYHTKLSGLQQRFKFRVRAYNLPSPDAINFLEIKRKDLDFVWKDRAPLRSADIDTFMISRDPSLLLAANGSRAVYERSANNFLYYFLLYQLRPLVLINYEREAFECGFGSTLRLTFDKNIRACQWNSLSNFCNGEREIPALKGCFVLEIKFRHSVPGWLTAILRKYDFFRSSASKYVMGMDASYQLQSTRQIFYDRKPSIN